MTVEPAAADEPPFTVPFGEQIEFLRGKVNLPTRTWRDIDGRAHDRAFVVAGVERDEVLAALKSDIDRAVADGRTLAQFRADFDAIVAKHGWIGGAGVDNPAWRSKVIYDTNVRTSYMAGRLKQMRDPDVVRLRPFWAYRHADIRVPLQPREQHLAWDGIVLLYDDPWWIKHYPPNGWGCTCGVRALSRREMERHQRARGKPEAVDTTPPDDPRPVTDPVTGEVDQVPAGVAFGWDHAPGDSWERGLVPPEAREPLDAPELPRRATATPPLAEVGRPLSTPITPAPASPAAAVDDFLASFGAARGADGARLFRDAAGQAVVISEELFQDAAGRSKVDRYGGERARHLPRLAEAIRDPDEVWVDWANDPQPSRPRLVRRYLRFDPAGSAFASFAYAPGFGWSGATTFSPKVGKSKAAQESYLTRQRTGALLYRRPKAR